MSGICLVTGGAGFIGSHLAERLARMGRRVRIVDNLATGKRETVRRLVEAFPEHVEFLEGDLRDETICRRAVAGCDVVFHQAALPSVERSVRDPLASHEANATATLRLLLACREEGIGRFVYAGSSSVYGDTPRLPKTETDPPNPRSPYALSKLVGEEYARLFHDLYGLSTLTLRYFNVFGPRQDPESPYAAVIPKFLTALLEGRAPVVFGDGRQTRDFTFVENVVEANLLAMERREVTGVLNVACGEETSLLELLEILQEITGRRVEPVFSDPRPGDVRHSRADIQRARTLLGYEPRVTLREGLRRTVEAFLELTRGGGERRGGA
jgi:UDP-glucose 4-epimerase